MAYLAIARKYRPATFDDIVGQDHVTRTLRNAIERQRIHHAYLFCGARGVGKTTAARALAKSLNCEKGPTADPCGECSSCVDISRGTSPDLIEIDGASNNSVDNVRELRESVRFAPSQGRKKIYLVDEVHMLSNAAFNALLKTLEEPPEHIVFLFATTEPHKIPDTILSRVQRFDFKRIPVSGVVQRLASIAEQEGVQISETGLRLIARAGEGSMRDSQSLLDKVISFGGEQIEDGSIADVLGLVDRRLLHDMLAHLLRGEPSEAIDLIARVHELGFEMQQFSAELLEWVRHATMARLSPSVHKHLDLPEDDLQRLLEVTEGVPEDVLHRLFHALLKNHEQVVRASRPRMVMEMAVARVAGIKPAEALPQLLARLESLEKRLRGRGPGAPSGGGGGGGHSTSRRVERGPQRRHRMPHAARPSGGRASRSRATTPRIDPDASDDDRWAAFQKVLHQVGATTLPTGTPRRERKALVLTVAKGRAWAAARREAQDPEVGSQLQAIYGPGVELRLVESLASQRRDIDPGLEQKVLADPACQRILRTLDATLVDITALSSEQSEE